MDTLLLLFPMCVGFCAGFLFWNVVFDVLSSFVLILLSKEA